MKILITLPHSNQTIPDNLRYQFKASEYQMNHHIDFGVDLFAQLEEFDCLEAPVSRFIVDLNRERDDIHSDQGVIINKDWDGNEVLVDPLTDMQVEERLKTYYDPFYDKLNTILNSTENLFVLDCHSMDSKGMNDTSERPDICLATNNSTSCSYEIIKIFKEEFRNAGFSVEENNPYSGSRANIMRVVNGKNAALLELEFNKKIYMNEETLVLKTDVFEKIQNVMRTCLEKVKDM